ncbi:MAG TPA: metalloregulator ArsR/SmtB family transcription factor [Bacillota bacterium]|nr:metalloregulator ArsR/SmtB family transcription factor [Bacillota bacterium]
MEIKKLADVFKALGDPTRLKIIALLNYRDCCVCELMPIFNVSQPSISKHMQRLKVTDLVTETRKGQWVFYSLNRSKLAEIQSSLENFPDLSETFKELEEKGLLVSCD